MPPRDDEPDTDADTFGLTWPPPTCPACAFQFCDHCDPVTGRGCEHDCPWLYEEAP